MELGIGWMLPYQCYPGTTTVDAGTFAPQVNSLPAVTQANLFLGLNDFLKRKKSHERQTLISVVAVNQKEKQKMKKERS